MQVTKSDRTIFGSLKYRINSVLDNIPSAASGLIVLGGALCGISTYIILTGLSPIRPTQTIISVLLVTNLVFVTVM